MKKKLFAWFMAITIVFSSLNIVAFADEETIEHYPNYSVDVCFTNYDCKYYDSSDLDIKLNITFSGKSIQIPVLYDDEYESYYVEGYSELLQGLIETNSTDFTTEVIIEDNDPEHNFQNDNNVELDIYTKQEIEESLDALANFIVAKIYESALDEQDTAALTELETIFGGTITLVDDVAMLNGTPLTFEDLVNAFKNNADALGLGEEGLAAIKEYEDMMASEDFIGSADFIINLSCDCPIIFEYHVFHEYYDTDGGLLDFDVKEYKAKPNDVIDVSDIPIFENYNGKKYKYIGAYLYNDEGDLDFNKPITSFTVDKDYFEIGLKYELVDSEKNAPATNTPTTPDNNDKTPETSDNFNVAPFMMLMILAILGALATIVTRKKI